MSIRQTALYTQSTSAPTGPTRFYLPSTGAAPVSPTQQAEWDSFASFDRIALVATKIGSASATKAVTDATATANRDVLVRQYVSDPLEAQTISGTVKGRIRAQEGATASNLRAQVIVKVTVGDTSTVRGVLYAGDLTTGTTNPTSEYGTALANRQHPRGASQALTSQAVTAGDRLVIEIGYRKHAAASTTGTLSFGDNAGTDLAEDETTTAANNPWIEFSGYVQFQTTVTPVAVSDTLDAGVSETAEVSRPPGFTVRQTTGGHALRDQTALREATLLDIPTDKAVSDTLAAGLTDAGLVGTDQEAIDGTDDNPVDLTESVALQRQSAVADTLTAGLTDTVVSAPAVAAADTLAADLTDAAAVQRQSTVADTGAADLTEASALQRQSSVADTGAVDLTTAASLAVAIAAADTNAVDLTESVVLETTGGTLDKTVADTLAAALTDAMALAVDAPLADALAAGMTEALVLAVARPAADTLAVDLADAADVALNKTVADTLAAGLSDGGSVTVPVAGTEARWARGGLRDRPDPATGGLRDRPFAVATAMQVRPDAATGGLTERPDAVLAALRDRPDPAGGGLTERPPAAAGTLKER